MTLLITNSRDVHEAYKAFFYAYARSGWLVLNFASPDKGSILQFIAAGPSIEDIHKLLENDRVQYVLVRLMNKQQEQPFDVLVKWIGKSARVDEKARSSGLETAIRSELNFKHWKELKDKNDLTENYFSSFKHLQLSRCVLKLRLARYSRDFAKVSDGRQESYVLTWQQVWAIHTEHQNLIEIIKGEDSIKSIQHFMNGLPLQAKIVCPIVTAVSLSSIYLFYNNTKQQETKQKYDAFVENCIAMVTNIERAFFKEELTDPNYKLDIPYLVSYSKAMESSKVLARRFATDERITSHQVYKLHYTISQLLSIWPEKYSLELRRQNDNPTEMCKGNKEYMDHIEKDPFIQSANIMVKSFLSYGDRIEKCLELIGYLLKSNGAKHLHYGLVSAIADVIMETPMTQLEPYATSKLNYIADFYSPFQSHFIGYSNVYLASKKLASFTHGGIHSIIGRLPLLLVKQKEDILSRVILLASGVPFLQLQSLLYILPRPTSSLLLASTVSIVNTIALDSLYLVGLQQQNNNNNNNSVRSFTQGLINLSLLFLHPVATNITNTRRRAFMMELLFFDVTSIQTSQHVPVDILGQILSDDEEDDDDDDDDDEDNEDEDKSEEGVDSSSDPVQIINKQE
ncbi:hypothetical protein DFA_04383 [Cavenderia fasciculata]|uniref:ADF-H domain-containing protein n=1 Tax=Cavenderia fasciculata TaxID=261658 RepID=F4PPF2_CACFS|nr:uncharacterized protein DFA_04383 [Cavenderia fasciculata]EGG22265.1 hypothetical protein DFA_04383 [Cavenderia fasciculata]|eukprot:XP_004360116.1 hypothetical protein DFA_04383 [Cavenderia fasciculata]